MKRHLRTLLIFLYCILFLLAAVPGVSQEYRVQGRIIDRDTREPLPFVNILINDSRQGGTTDIDGKFALGADEPILYLRLSYVGYEPVEYPVGEGGKRLLINMKAKEFSLPEVVITPGINPAHRIIRNVLANRERNNPESLPAFSYTAYEKFVFTIELDSLLRRDSATLDTSDIELMKFLDEHHLFLMENVSERKYRHPGKNLETVLATRVSGLQDPFFIFLISQLQSTSFYDDVFTLADKNYINPISRGSLDRYYFQIEDTAWSGRSDTVFIISYRPLLNANFDGLTGLLYINTHGWAIQSVTAGPARQEGGLGLKIQQMYELIDGSQWFPVQLNTEIRLNNVTASGDEVTISTGGTSGIYNPIGIGRSYIHDIRINPDLPGRLFGHVELEMDPNATHRDSQYWRGYRLDTLTPRELNTYHFIDSIGKEINLDRIARTTESLITGTIPWGKVDLDIDRFLRYDDYEGLAPGIGLHTHERLSGFFRLGGYVRYGLKDKEPKYGGDVSFTFDRYRDIRLGAFYSNDVAETAGTLFFDEQIRFFRPESFRSLLIRRMDKTEAWGAFMDFRLLDYFKIHGGITVTGRQVTTPYRYAVTSETMAVLLDRYRFADLTLGIRWAHREKYVQNMRKKIPLGTRWPVVHLQYIRGLEGILDGEYDYHRLDLRLEKSFYFKYLGRTRFRLNAGVVDRAIPYTNLYNGNGSYRDFTLYAPYSFATMRMNEFLSDRYAALFVVHDFGKLLWRGEKFEPEISLAFHAGIGDLVHPQPHYQVEYKTMDQGYYEAGFLVNNLLNLKLYSLGLGAFWRIGPYSYDQSIKNLAAKLTLSFPF
ncbi:MAG: carboxypeptidase-like regulatory domain-containing protein [Bacteroidales bacterium]|nr:carboxypeptidase-like regulatory domain-containing protein [Bacteroidales bacterium]